MTVVERVILLPDFVVKSDAALMLNPRSATSRWTLIRFRWIWLMSNVELRRRLDKLSPAIVACMIDQGTAYDDGGILEFSYDGYCHPSKSIRDATRVVERLNPR